VPGEPDACDVEVSAGSVIFIFHTSRLFLSRRKLEGHVAVDWRSPAGMDPRTIGLPMGRLAPTNVDWRSNSSLDTQRKRLQEYYDPEKKFGFPWMQIIQWAAERVDEFVTMAGDFEVAAHYDYVEPHYLIRPIWPGNGATVWFGQGETCKGVLAVASGVALATGKHLAGLRCEGQKAGIIYVDYEDDFEEFSIRVSRYINGLNLPIPAKLRRFDARGRLFTDIADQLKAKIKADGGADAVIIDSALPAVGGEAVQPEPVGAFFNSLDWLGMPALIIAHENRQGNDEFPFGSQLWRTRARMNVNFQAGEEGKTTEGNFCRDVLLRCTKANNVRRFTPLAFRVEFSDDEAMSGAHTGAPIDRPLARTWLSQIDPTQVSPDLAGKLPPLRRLIAYVRENPGQPLSEVAKGAELNPLIARNLLTRNPSIFVSEGGSRGRGNASTWKVIEAASA